MVSVVIPVKDDAPALARCLEALRAQTRHIDEVLVVDNGSTDGSRAVAVAAAGARVVSCAEPGIPAASAVGYDAAQGDLILRLDADCVPSPRWAEAVIDAFESRPDVGAFTGGAHFMDGPLVLRGSLARMYLLGYALAAGAALGHLPLFGSNFAMRRGVWRDIRQGVHRHDPELHDDFDLAFHLGERHRIRYARGASMGMSMRPFGSGRAFVRRVHRGFHTVAVHWPRDFPPVRWVRLAVRRSRHPESSADAAMTLRGDRAPSAG